MGDFSDLSDACAAWAKGCYGARAASCNLKLAAAAAAARDDNNTVLNHGQNKLHSIAAHVSDTLAGCSRGSTGHVTFTHMACTHAAAAAATSCIAYAQQRHSQERLTRCGDDDLIKWAQLSPVCSCDRNYKYNASGGGGSSSSDGSSALEDSCWLQLRLVWRHCRTHAGHIHGTLATSTSTFTSTSTSTSTTTPPTHSAHLLPPSAGSSTTSHSPGAPPIP
jgi:hypothetical protein